MADTPICPICQRPADASGRATCRCADVEVLPRPAARPDDGPDPADVAMFEKAGRPDGGTSAPSDTSPLPVVADEPPRRRVRRGLVLAVGGTALAVVGSGVLIAGMFTQGDDPFDEARFGDRGGAPTLLLPTGEAEGAAETGAGTTASAAPSASPSPSSSASPSRSPSPSSSTSGAPSARPEPGEGDARPSSSADAPGQGGRDGRGGWGDGGERGDGDRWGDGGRSAVLREGDTGPEVAELQYRLRQTYAYRGDVDGRYDGDVREGVATFQTWYGVRGDPEGVYGPNTRRALEGATGGGR
ncbi:peptidoglycan-binding domain-containing protein [Streptomyces megasporus]|uniref:peptidoglycan-binding domain-containing protein n=1 Tax=Streptomyces megasporus TaxID=44060 RepID=UPI0012FF54AD|nr:peptidoglycan-binding domain-containing protein [Streptomyces megasporus]